MPERAAKVAGIIRERLLWGLHTGTIHPGDRVSSVREIAARHAIDLRTALRACRTLEAEGLIEMRRRSGMYVCLPESNVLRPDGTARLFVDLLVEAHSRGIPPVELPARLAEVFRGREIHVACVGSSIEQAQMIRAMAEDQYGVEAFAASEEELADEPTAERIRSATASITTVFDLAAVRRLLVPLARPVFVATVEPVQRAQLLNPYEPLYVILVDRRWADRVKAALTGTKAGENLHLYVLGEDDLTQIPESVPIYASPMAAPLLRSLPILDGRVRELRYALQASEARGLISTIVAAHGGV